MLIIQRWKQEKKKILNQKGWFINILIPAIISGEASIIASIINKPAVIQPVKEVISEQNRVWIAIMYQQDGEMTDLKYSKKMNTGPFVYKTPLQEYINDLDEKF